MWTNVNDFSKVRDSFYGGIKLKTLSILNMHAPW